MCYSHIVGLAIMGRARDIMRGEVVGRDWDMMGGEVVQRRRPNTVKPAPDMPCATNHWAAKGNSLNSSNRSRSYLCFHFP